MSDGDAKVAIPHCHLFARCCRVWVGRQAAPQFCGARVNSALLGVPGTGVVHGEHDVLFMRVG